VQGEKIRNQLPLAKGTFLIVMFHFSLRKSAMNAPRFCEFRKDRLTGIGPGGCLLRIFQFFKLNLMAHYLRSGFSTKVPFLPISWSLLSLCSMYLKVPKCENFHRTDFFYFFTIKPLWVGDFRAKIKNSKF
jgi:hypothetical protein